MILLRRRYREPADQRGRPESGDEHVGVPDASRLRRVVLTVAVLNFSYFFVEFSVALVAGSVALLADSVDFLEDTSVNLLIFVALGWPLARRAVMGKVMALIILGPAAVATWQAVGRFSDPAGGPGSSGHEQESPVSSVPLTRAVLCPQPCDGGACPQVSNCWSIRSSFLAGLGS